MHKIRTTIRPDIEIEVDDEEYADLKAQGLIVEEQADAASTEKEPEADAGSQHSKKNSGATASENKE